MSPIWKKIERIGVENFPRCLDDDDNCYYARDYISEGGFAASAANNLITNFKKPPDRRGKLEWKYKEWAIKEFANEISCIKNIDQFLVTIIPSSKIPTDPLYDSRMEDMLKVLKKLKPGLTIEFPLSIKGNMVASHCGGTRNIQDIYTMLHWKGIISTLTNIVLIDDVITTGAHFKACKQMLSEKIPHANVIGLFWARTVRPSG